MCHECTSLVEQSVANLDGVIGVTSMHARSLTSVMFDEARVNREDIIQAIRTAGFGAEFMDDPLLLETQ
jgi:copper chaperone CopZ